MDTFSREFWPFEKWIFSTFLYILQFSNGHNSLNKLDRHLQMKRDTMLISILVFCLTFSFTNTQCGVNCCVFALVAIITTRVRSTREGNVYTWECLFVHRGWRGTYIDWGYLPWLGGGTYLRGGYLPWLGVPTLNWGVPTWLGGTYLGCRYLPWPRGTYLGWGVSTLDKLCRGWYASCGFPQEDFLVLFVMLNGSETRVKAS